MKGVTAVKSEKDWKAENDANTIAEAEAIKADKERLAGAKKAAAKMAKEQRARADGLTKLAGRRSGRGRSRKR
jgi:hypothetical protein